VGVADGGGMQPTFAALTRPPETVLLILGSTTGAGAVEDGLIGVLDTHTRSLASRHYPASFYKCTSLRHLAELLTYSFFPLPEVSRPRPCVRTQCHRVTM
jgi:hypothetical protein